MIYIFLDDTTTLHIQQQRVQTIINRISLYVRVQNIHFSICTLTSNLIQKDLPNMVNLNKMITTTSECHPCHDIHHIASNLEDR